MKLDIYQQSGKKTSKKITLKNEVFSSTPNDHCIYLAINSEMAAIRQGTHSSKTRSEVSGSGSKPWRQKGTGRARIGSIRNPSRVHGSKAFGPKPHKYIKKVNKKVKQNARRSVLSNKVSEKNFIVIDSIKLDLPKTSLFVDLLKNFNLYGKKVTILINKIEDNLYLGSRNINNVSIVLASSASTYDLLDCQSIIADIGSVEILNNQLSSTNVK